MTALHTDEYGHRQGPPLLAIHGVTAHGGRFESLCSGPLADYRTVAVDLRGHGDSLWIPPFGFDQHVRDLIDTLDAQSIERCAAIGHSFGGMLAMQLLAAAPERIERVVLLDPAIAMNGATAAERAEATRSDTSFATLAEGIAEYLIGRPESTHAAATADARDHIRQDSDGRFRLHYSRPAAICAWSDMARLLPVSLPPRPILLITAGREAFVTDALRASLPPHEEHVLDCGHIVYWECFDEVAELVGGFLRRAQ